MRWTRNLGLAGIAAALIGGFTACGNRTAPLTEHKGSIIALTDSILSAGGSDTVRFGRLHSGEIAVKQLWIENRAARPTAVVSYDTDCGCTSLEFDAQPIRSGQAQRVALTFDSRGQHGWQLKILDITLAEASLPLRLFVEAEVE